MTALRMLIFMLCSWVGGVWVAWGVSGFVLPDPSTRWVWLVAAAFLAAGLAILVAREVRSGRLRVTPRPSPAPSPSSADKRSPAA